MSDLYGFAYTLDETLKTMEDVISTGNHDRMFLDTYYWLKTLKEYQEIGTMEECWEAVEKQKPKKPVCKPKPYNESVGFNEEWFCPSCGAYIGYFYEGMDEPEQMEYCNECRQHIARDWSDKFDDE